MITAILVAMAIAIGAIALHASYMCVELKGYERGLDEAERIIRGVRHEDTHNK